jgi:hypothetical protein
VSHSAPTLPPAQRFGYRGRALTLVGVVWILVGVAVILHPYVDPNRMMLHEHLPISVRVVLWVGAGVCALVTSWWPAGADRFGFMALVIPATIRAGSFAWSALLGFVTDDAIGDRSRWVEALAWASIVLFVELLAAWPEPAAVRHDDEASR